MSKLCNSFLLVSLGCLVTRHVKQSPKQEDQDIQSNARSRAASFTRDFAWFD